MKTLKLFVIVFFIAAFTANNVNAQKGVVKWEMTSPVTGLFPCTGDYLFGEVTYVEFNTANGDGWVEKVKNATIMGYKDENLTIPSGHVYELSQVDTGKNDWKSAELTSNFKMDGKIVALIHMVFHTTINANGTVTVDFVKSSFECK